VVIQPVLDAGLAWLAVVIALNAVLAAFYYYGSWSTCTCTTRREAARLVTGRTLSVSLGIASFAVILFGILPNSIYQWALEPRSRSSAEPLSPSRAGGLGGCAPRPIHRRRRSDAITSGASSSGK